MMKVTANFGATLVCSSIILLNASLPAHADRAKDAAILSALEGFNNSVGCRGAFDPGNVKPVLVAQSDIGESLYLAFPIMDIGCAGGMGTSSATPVIVRANGNNDITLDSYDTGPEFFDGVNFRFLDEVAFVSPGRVLIRWRELSDNDALCCASVRREAIYRWRLNDEWVPE